MSNAQQAVLKENDTSIETKTPDAGEGGLVQLPILASRGVPSGVAQPPSETGVRGHCHGTRDCFILLYTSPTSRQRFVFTIQSVTIFQKIGPELPAADLTLTHRSP